MDKLSDLRGIVEFVATAESGSFSAAARRLNVSVAHVSRMVAGLEADLQVQLVTRNTRSSSLTEPGATFHRRCRSLLDALDEARDLAKGTPALSGRIRMTMGGHFAETVLAPLVATFAALHPDVTLELEMTSRNVRLVEEDFDLAVRAGPLEPSSLMARRLIGFPLVTLAAPGLFAVTPATPQELDPTQCLALGARPWQFSQNGADARLQPQGRLRSNSGTFLVQSAVAGAGAIQVPAYYGAGDLASGRLTQLLLEWIATQEFEFFIVYPQQRYVPSRLRALIDYMVTELQMQVFFRPTAVRTT